MPIIVRCNNCQNDIIKPPSLVKAHNFCGNRCYAIWKKGSTGEKNANWRGGLRSIACAHCGVNFKAIPAEASRRVYCSIACKRVATRVLTPCLHCGTPFSAHKALRFCRFECFTQYVRVHPETTSQWKDGHARSPYATGWNNVRRRQAILERDGYRCRGCARPTEEAGKLYRHHLDGTKTNHDPANLVSLCAVCHQKIHDGSLTLP